MRYIHLQNRLLLILEKYRRWHQIALTREQWVDHAMKNILVWCHHPILGTFKRSAFRSEIEKVINPLIPSSELFDTMSREDKLSYYVTYNEATDSNGNPVHAILEVTDKGKHFIGFGGFEQRIHQEYGLLMSSANFFAIYLPIFWALLIWTYNKMAVLYILLAYK